MAEQTGETWVNRLAAFANKYPLLAVCIWMGYQQIKKEGTDEKKDQAVEKRMEQLERDRKIEQEQDNEIKKDLIKLLKDNLMSKYEKDTAK